MSLGVTHGRKLSAQPAASHPVGADEDNSETHQREPVERAVTVERQTEQVRSVDVDVRQEVRVLENEPVDDEAEREGGQREEEPASAQGGDLPKCEQGSSVT